MFPNDLKLVGRQIICHFSSPIKVWDQLLSVCITVFLMMSCKPKVCVTELLSFKKLKHKKLPITLFSLAFELIWVIWGPPPFAELTKFDNTDTNIRVTSHIFHIITTSEAFLLPHFHLADATDLTPTNVSVLFVIYNAFLQIPVLSLWMFFHSDTSISVRGKFPSFSSSESGKFPFIPHELWLLVSLSSELHILSLNINSQSYRSHHSLMYLIQDNPCHQNHCQYFLDLSMVHFQDQFSLPLSKKSLLSIIFIIYSLSFQELPQSL